MRSIVVTSISGPNPVLRALAEGSPAAGCEFLVIGDRKSPPDFALEGCRYLGLEAQAGTGFGFAAACPVGHYARKNIGYLLAARHGAEAIVETDDDNFPRDAFFQGRPRWLEATVAKAPGWLNVYRYFSEADIWPRGLPLDRIRDAPPPFGSFATGSVDCPIQQGLADENPDVDAIYRLLGTLPQSFRTDREIALSAGTWCPFNSQNTTWWPDAYGLLYLPAYCSFRMTDIWRSFVAQRICWENGWHVLFHGPSVWQDRNAHDLMKDFAEEVPGYLHNDRIRKTLEDLDLPGGPDRIGENLRRCYRALVGLEVVGREELALLDCWIADIGAAMGAARG